MNRLDFNTLVKPLSKKELDYKFHPKLSSSFYQSLNYTIVDGQKIYSFPNFFSSSDKGKHGLILSDGKSGIDLGEFGSKLMLNKQTRYSEVPLHTHSYIELNYVYQGHCTTIIDKKEIDLKEGTVCILDKDVVHTIKKLEENDIVLNFIISPEYFTPAFLSRLGEGSFISSFIAQSLETNTMHDKFLILDTSDNPLIKETIENIFCEFLDSSIYSIDIIESLMNVFFIHLARSYIINKEQTIKSSFSYLSSVIKYIEQNCTTCTLESTAKEFNLHPNYLSRAIKNASGLTFKEVVNKQRLKLSEFMLLNTDMAISDIAEKCGWSNQTQYYKKFTEVYNCTPHKFRNQKKQVK